MVEIKRRNKEPLFYMGLDLSLTGTGVIVLNSDNEVEMNKTLKSKLKGMARLYHIREEIKFSVELWKPKVICIEGYSMGSRAGQAFSIGELGGVIKLMFFEKDYVPYLVPPTRLKKFITGGGKAEKDMILMKVFQRWGFEAADNNQADAYGLAKIAKELKAPESESLNKAQLEVIHDILNPPEPKKKGKK
jgi:crossover junction endodeoxyribonuclease RuvC